MEEIRNPIKQKIILTYIGVAFGIVLILAPMIISLFKIYQFYFVYAGVVVIGFSIGFYIFYSKRSQQFKKLIEEKEEYLVWSYDDDQYLEFVGELSKLQRTANRKTVLILIAIITVTSIALFIGLEDEIKYLGVVFFVLLGIMSLLFTVVFPESFKYQASTKPFVTIINRDEAYIMGRYHKWTKARAMIKNYDNGVKMYKVLAINYEALTRNGKLFQEWTAMIPDAKDKEIMAEAKRWVNRINKLSREREDEKKLKKSWSEKAFDKMMGKNK